MIGAAMHDAMTNGRELLATQMGVDESQQAVEDEGEGLCATCRPGSFGQHRSSGVARKQMRRRVQVFDLTAHGDLQRGGPGEQGEFQAGRTGVQREDRPGFDHRAPPYWPAGMSQVSAPMMTSVERIEQADGRRNLDSRSEGVPAVFGKALSFLILRESHPAMITL
jgi:hypothetical protein